MKNEKAVDRMAKETRPFGVELLEPLPEEEAARINGGNKHKYHTMMASYPAPHGNHLIGDY
ncbi:hypothetical protein HY251_17955 [bacterium]|nr:hypothetical protein [bacterium]